MLCPDLHPGERARRDELDRVAQQVREDLRQSGCVRRNRRQGRLDFDVAGRWLQIGIGRQDFADETGRIDGRKRKFTASYFAVVEQVANVVVQSAGGGIHPLQIVAASSVELWAVLL